MSITENVWNKHKDALELAQGVSEEEDFEDEETLEFDFEWVGFAM